MATLAQIDRLFETMGRVDPLDLLRAPDWLPRITRWRGRKTMAFFRRIVAETMDMRKQRIANDPDGAPEDFLTLLLRTEGPDGLTSAEIADNIITFIGAWNSFLWPFLVAQDETKMTVTVGITAVQDAFGVYYARLLAGAVLAGLPVALAYLLFQRRVTQAITLSAGIKG